MPNIFFIAVDKKKQFVYSFLLVVFVAIICYFISFYTGYHLIAFILLLTVSVIAMLFDILPVLMAAFLSALIWDFFFIPPYFTLQVGTSEDTMLLLMYFVIAMINAMLTYKIRAMEKIAVQKDEKENTLKLYATLFNSLSHELRTPIATIIGATDNLQSISSKLTPKNRYDLINEISIASFRLNQQVDNLLNMSRIEAGFIEAKNDWCDINELVYEVIKRIESGNISQTFRISINPAIPFFKLDKGLLEQIIYNLLNNAVTYTPPNSVIHISAACYSDVLRIIIEDNGDGFPLNEIDRVFDKFYRLKNVSAGGTGLGLSIVKGFTEALNGSVTLENIKIGGARFTLDIPAETSYLKNLKNE